MNERIFAAIALVTLAVANTATAATFCISNVSQLDPALTTAASNGQDDTIYIEVGTYLTTAELGYFAGPAETHRISVIGGMAPGCLSGFSDTGSTVLDGQNTHRLLTISAFGEVDVGRIIFQNGNPSQYFGGALSVGATGADTYVYANQFVANKTAPGAAGGALYVGQFNANAYIWSNLFLANSSNGGAIYTGGVGTVNVYITGNTVIANTLINHTGLSGGVDIANSGGAWISNNVFWNNENSDIYDQVGQARYANNDIGVRQGFAPISVVGELNVEPKFDGFLSFRPAPDSPLVNAGLDTAPGGAGGCCDASGDVRKQGRHVDIGAFESDVLFRDALGG